MAGIIAFFTALPALVQIMSEMGALMSRLITWTQDNNYNEWRNGLEDAMDKLEAAKTSDDRLTAAQYMVGMIKNLGAK